MTIRRHARWVGALTTPGALPALDGLRAVAILLVLVTHVAQHIPAVSSQLTGTFWARPLNNGWIGVDLFFVLSGFLVGGAVLRAVADHRFSFRTFYLRRGFRILPAYFTVIFALCLIRFGWPELGRVPHFSWAQVVPNVFLLTDYWPNDIGVPSWSLSIEEHFYLLIPLLLLAARNFLPANRCRLLLSFVFLALFARMISYRLGDFASATTGDVILRLIYYPFHTRMDALAMGVLVAALHQENPGAVPASWRVIAGALGFLLTGYVYFSGAIYGRWGAITLQYTLLAMGFGAILWSVLPAAPVTLPGRLLAAKFWVPLARLSYSIYLTHLVVLQFADNAGRPFWLSAIIMPMICLVVALPLFLLVEDPLHRFARRNFQ